MKVIGTDGKEYTIKPDANLRDTNLEWANLRSANLRGTTNLRGLI